MHDHSHPHSSKELTASPSTGEAVAQRRALAIALAITASFVVVEVVAGLAFNSLALTADAAHLVSDCFALGLALIAQQLAARPASPRHSFGWRRAEVIAAQVNGLVLLGVSIWIIYEALSRLGRPQEINSVGLMVVAALGLLANLASALLLSRAPGHNLNVRAAALHTISDAAGSIGALMAGVAAYVWGATWADPAASILIALLVVTAALRLLRDTSHVLLEGTPRHLDPVEVEETLASDPAVMAVHHLHLWTIASDTVALSAHVEVEGPTTLHDAQAESIRLKDMLLNRYGIAHSTLELECHPCEPDHQTH